MISSDLISLIQKACTDYSVNPSLMSAFILVESSGNPWLTRYEPTWEYFYYPEYFSKICYVNEKTETVMQSMSWGLMQLMGSVARELGFDQPLPKLCVPEINLKYAAIKISEISKKFSNQNDLISVYNAGSIHKSENGDYVNQDYVNRVNRFLNAFTTKFTG